MLSQGFEQQLIERETQLKPIFKKTLQLLISSRLLNPKLQENNFGSSHLGRALSLILASYRKAPKLVTEVRSFRQDRGR